MDSIILLRLIFPFITAPLAQCDETEDLPACGTLTNWYACAARDGGGCCLKGLVCQAGQDCVPSSFMTSSSFETISEESTTEEATTIRDESTTAELTTSKSGPPESEFSTEPSMTTTSFDVDETRLASSSILSENPTCEGRDVYIACAESEGGNCCPPNYACFSSSGLQCRDRQRIDPRALSSRTETFTITSNNEEIVKTTVRTLDPVDDIITRIEPLRASDDEASASGGLTKQEIGGIVGGVVGGCLLGLGSVGMLIRHRKRQRTMENDPSLQDPSTGKHELDSGSTSYANYMNTYDPYEMPGSHNEWELVGGYEAHGVSELEAAVPKESQKPP